VSVTNQQEQTAHIERGRLIGAMDPKGSNAVGGYAQHGVGLLMGSPFPDGTMVGALDIDRDEYTRISQVFLHHPPCGRIGKKGAVFSVCIRGDWPPAGASDRQGISDS
jgi:hypothetical protein